MRGVCQCRNAAKNAARPDRDSRGMRPEIRLSRGASPLAEDGGLPAKKLDRRNRTHAKTMKLTSLKNLLIQEIKDLHSAENQLLKALPKMAEAATDKELKKAFQTHLRETQGQVERLEKIAETLGASPRGVVCAALKGLVEEGSEVIEEDAEPVIRDLALIIAAQKVEHYEIASYGGARALAETLELPDVAEQLQTTLDEEGRTDDLLTGLATRLLGEAVEEAGAAAVAG